MGGAGAACFQGGCKGLRERQSWKAIGLSEATRCHAVLGQGLLFWLFQRGLKVTLDAVGGTEAVIALTLIFLK